MVFDTEGNQVYPCWCGETHSGDYGLYDYGHHNCFHDAALSWDVDTGTLMCPACGLTFAVNPPVPLGRVGARRILRSYGFRFDWVHFWRGQWVKP
jgi:hypothetical protein